MGRVERACGTVVFVGQDIQGLEERTLDQSELQILVTSRINQGSSGFIFGGQPGCFGSFDPQPGLSQIRLRRVHLLRLFAPGCIWSPMASGRVRKLQGPPSRHMIFQQSRPHLPRVPRSRRKTRHLVHLWVCNIHQKDHPPSTTLPTVVTHLPVHAPSPQTSRPLPVTPAPHQHTACHTAWFWTPTHPLGGRQGVDEEGRRLDDEHLPGCARRTRGGTVLDWVGERLI